VLEIDAAKPAQIVGYQTRSNWQTQFLLVSLFIRAPDFGFLKPLHRATQFLRFGRARIIHDTNQFPAP
jgi:hypothetical protein